MSDDWEIKVEYCEFQAVGREITNEVGMHVGTIAYKVLGDAVMRIQNPPKSGRLYKRGKKGRMHQASAKGESPASDTGHLANAAKVSKVGPCEWEVAFNAEYAARLEAEDGLDRPFLQPALEKYSGEFVRGLREILGDRA